MKIKKLLSLMCVFICTVIFSCSSAFAMTPLSDKDLGKVRNFDVYGWHGQSTRREDPIDSINKMNKEFEKTGRELGEALILWGRAERERASLGQDTGGCTIV